METNNNIEITENDTVLYFKINEYSDIDKPYVRKNDNDHYTNVYTFMGVSITYDYVLMTELPHLNLVKYVFVNNDDLTIKYNPFLVKVEQLSNLLTDGTHMFNDCESLTDVSNLKIPPRIEDCSYMFCNCAIETINNVTLHNNVKNIYAMFGFNRIKTINDFMIPYFKDNNTIRYIFLGNSDIQNINGVKMFLNYNNV